MNETTWLRSALIGNAVFSTSSGLLLASRPDLVVSWLGVDASLLFQIIGFGLLLFAADLLHQATRRRVATWRALYASVGDFSWVGGTAVLLIVMPNKLSALGVSLLLGVAAIVLLFGVWQFWAIGRVHQRKVDGVYRHCILVDTAVPADAMWEVISDLGQIRQHAPSLKRSIIEDDEDCGIGSVRTCEDHNGRRWSEQCTDFRPGRGFALRFMTEADDFPYPATMMRGGWEVTAAQNGSRVMIWLELDPKPRWLSRIIIALLAFQADRSFPKIVASMARQAAGQSTTNVHRTPFLARLVPQAC